MKYKVEELRATAFMTKDHNYAWYRINNRKTIGDMMYLLNKYKPTSIEDFYTKYTNDYECDGNPQHRGRTLEEIEQIAIKYKSLSGDDIPLETYIKNILWHTIVQTWDGYSRECDLQGYGALRGYELRKTNNEDDATLGVDFEVRINDNLKCFIQLKPETFLKGNSNKSLINDRRLAILKVEKVKEIYNVPTYYVFYRQDGTYKYDTNNHKICYRLNDLVNADGTMKV